MTSKQYQSKGYVLDHGRFILTRNYLPNMIKYVSQTKEKGYSSVGRAPRLHVRQCFFRGVHPIMESKELILLRNRCLTP